MQYALRHVCRQALKDETTQSLLQDTNYCATVPKTLSSRLPSDSLFIFAGRHCRPVSCIHACHEKVRPTLCAPYCNLQFGCLPKRPNCLRLGAFDEMLDKLLVPQIQPLFACSSCWSVRVRVKDWPMDIPIESRDRVIEVNLPRTGMVRGTVEGCALRYTL